MYKGFAELGCMCAHMHGCSVSTQRLSALIEERDVTGKTRLRKMSLWCKKLISPDLLCLPLYLSHSRSSISTILAIHWWAEREKNFTETPGNSSVIKFSRYLFLCQIKWKEANISKVCERERLILRLSMQRKLVHWSRENSLKRMKPQVFNWLHN